MEVATVFGVFFVHLTDSAFLAEIVNILAHVFPVKMLPDGVLSPGFARMHEQLMIPLQHLICEMLGGTDFVMLAHQGERSACTHERFGNQFVGGQELKQVFIFLLLLL